MKDMKKMATVTISKELISRGRRYEFTKRLYRQRVSLAGLPRAHRLEEEVDVHGGWARTARNAKTARLPVGLLPEGTPTITNGRINPEHLLMEGTLECHRQQF